MLNLPKIVEYRDIGLLCLQGLGPADIGHLQQVNKKLHQTINESPIWKTLFFRYFPYAKEGIHYHSDTQLNREFFVKSYVLGKKRNWEKFTYRQTEIKIDAAKPTCLAA